VNDTVLSVRNLRVSLPRDGHSVDVVNHASFNLGRSEVLALVGESGSGKTKTAQALMGLLPRDRWRVTSDTIDLDGTNLAALTESGMRRVRGRQMSMIFQEPMTALDPVFRVGDQLGAVFRRHSGESRRQARSSAGTMLERVGFGDPSYVLSSYPHQLSGGMRQRVMIAMAMACRPKVLVADEPTTALDVTTQAQVLEQLTALARAQNTAMLLITHDLGVVAQYCDRALVMLEGTIVEDAPVAELFSRPRHDYTRRLLSFSAAATGS